ncbi:Retrovirus-related Pol polyprotein from transposon RE2 [Bienertia sinuspersici]
MKDNTDPVKADAWVTCNNMVISWLMASVSDSIKQSFMFTDSAAEIWEELETKFSVSSGSRKYELCKSMYETKQQSRRISDYYTILKSKWEEFESLRNLPVLTTLNSEIREYLRAIHREKEEQKLFQFLNGLNDKYGTMRSHILMMNPLPTVESACGMLQQEESQQRIYAGGNEEHEVLAMMGKKQDLKCHNCGKTGHNQNTCWACKNKETSKAPGSWSKGKEKVVANVCTQAEKGGWTTEQLEQLLRMLPLPSKSGHDDSEDEIDINSVEVIQCNEAHAKKNEWLLDSGATHHITGCLEYLQNARKGEFNSKIHLPNGGTAEVTHVGEVELKNGLKLKNVIYAPHFQHNLISVQKLSQQEDCEVIFTQEHCMIKDRSSPYVLGVGRMVKGVYHLVNMKVEKLAEKLKHHVQQYQHLCNDDTGKNLMNEIDDIDHEGEDTSQNHIDSDLTSESLQSGVHDEQPDEEEVESQPEIVSYERKSSREHKAPSWHKDYLVGSVQAAPNPQVRWMLVSYNGWRLVCWVKVEFGGWSWVEVGLLGGGGFVGWREENGDVMSVDGRRSEERGGRRGSKEKREKK